ncbi:hypothetical protein [Paraburkholderia oxyphila]|uniref:hypothetical protein n=1 Tax=Paraburkholderia oxyphila TaxID=614212 RepID=UPI003898DE62
MGTSGRRNDFALRHAHGGGQQRRDRVSAPISDLPIEVTRSNLDMAAATSKNARRAIDPVSQAAKR